MTDRHFVQGESVAIGYVHPTDTVGADFHSSLVKLLVKDAGGPRRVRCHLHLASGANITSSRNQLVRGFLDLRPKVDWLLWLDADMSFEDDLVERLLTSAHPKDRPIVGGLCFALDRGEGSKQEIVPTIYTFDTSQAEPIMLRWGAYPKEKQVLVAATGCACILVHRSVFEDLEPKWPAPWHWYQEAIVGGEPMGEDVMFCLRAGQAGFPLYVDTRVKTGHTKPFILNEQLYMKQFNDGEPQCYDAQDINTYVIIPVKNRRDLTKSILTQLKKQGGYTEILVYDNGSTDGTVTYLERQDVASSFDAKGAGIYNIWNEGVKQAQRLAEGYPCNIAILNNDLMLGNSFLERMAHALRSGPTSLVAVSGNYDGRTGPTEVLPTTGTFKNGGLAGFAFMVKGEAMGTTVPYFDEHYTWYFGDDDFVHSIEQAGGTVGIATPADFIHIGGGSQTSSNGTRERLGTKELRDSVDGDTAYYMSKWAPVAAGATRDA